MGTLFPRTPMKTALLILLAGTLGCSSLPKGSYGAVYDLETEKPIAGAAVTIHRTGR